MAHYIALSFEMQNNDACKLKIVFSLEFFLFFCKKNISRFDLFPFICMPFSSSCIEEMWRANENKQFR